MKTLKIHQYNELFFSDIRFWIEVKDNNIYRTSWITYGSKHTSESSDDTILLSDNDKNTTFYFNKNLSE